MADGNKTTGQQGKETIQRVFSSMMDDAKEYADVQELDRIKATDYYNGKGFGDEEEGRSQFVVTELRDAVLGIIPSLLRVLLGSDRAVEFKPRKAKDALFAEQATEVIHFEFMERNDGFSNTMAVLKDGLIRRIGAFKWGWEEGPTTSYRMENQTEEDLLWYHADEEVDITSTEKNEDGTYTIDLTKKAYGCIRVWAIPPEELLWNREARAAKTASLIAHRAERRRGELTAMGIPEAFLNELSSGEARDGNTPSQSEVSRRDDATGGTQDGDGGRENDKYLLTEAYVKLDCDGDGKSELRRIIALGPNYKIYENLPWDQIQIAPFSPDPEPHTLQGHGYWDRLKDLQSLKSHTIRLTLDSLVGAIFPRMTYEQGYASVSDLMNTAMGGLIRITKAGAVQTVTTPFVGKEAFPLLQYCDDMVERRVGRRHQGVNGLDSDALQSTTKSAADAIVENAQEQAELIARVFAETCMKEMFKGMLRTYAKHNPKKHTVRLRGTWVDIEPGIWDIDMDVQVNVALGAGFTERKIQTLVAVAAQQKEIIQTYGPSNPLCTIGMFRNTVARVLALQGIMDVDSYFKPVPPNWEPPPSPPQPTPEQTLAEAQVNIEKLRTVSDLTRKKDELALKEKEAAMEFTLKVRQMVTDARVKIAVAQLAAKNKVDVKQIEADIEREMREAEMSLSAQSQLHEQGLAEQGQAHEQDLAEQDQTHNHEMDAAAASAEGAPSE